MDTKRCSGYKGHWECEGHAPLSEFHKDGASKDGHYHRCMKCMSYRDRMDASPRLNPSKNAISARAYKMAGGSKAFYELPKEKRLELRKMAKEGWTDMYPKPTEHGAKVVPIFKRDEPVGAPMRTREHSEMQGEVVPQGWVYVVQNPDLPHILKIGKTYPDGIGSIMSNARRFGRAVLVEKYYFDEALEAEKAIHGKLVKWNMRVLGYEDCGKELFKCSVNCFRKALCEYHQELIDEASVG